MSTFSASYIKPKKYPPISKKPNLTLETPAQPHLVFLISDFLSKAEASALLAHLTALQPLAVSSHAQTRGTAFRDNDRSAFECAALSSLLWEQSGLADLVKGAKCLEGGVPRKSSKPCGLNTNWRLYRYRPGQRFGPHYDEEADGGEGGGKGVYTLLIYLSGEEDSTPSAAAGPKTKKLKITNSGDAAVASLIGGETVFYTGSSVRNKKVALSIRPKVGLALLHAQGAKCMLHEGAEVKQGFKWVLRSDVMYSTSA
ncbi:hypothetical protein DFJ77DRAFT_468550 [Powellomyces hirtus]|nr:hypothetical protein DFJ77DRAFT_468550 [Powellomyces hirtus]